MDVVREKFIEIDIEELNEIGAKEWRDTIKN